MDRKRNGEGYGINAFMGIGSPRHRRTENIALCNSINRVREVRTDRDGLTRAHTSTHSSDYASRKAVHVSDVNVPETW